MLTEEEKESITRLKFKSDTYSLIVSKLTDRLVQENEELRSDKNHLLGIAKILQSQLDAIKKAWAETLIKYNSVAHHFSFVCDEEIELGDAIEALDKLIGGGK